MAIVITNGLYYIKYNETGGIVKTKNIDEAFQYEDVDHAVKKIKKAKGKTKGYYIYDTCTKYILWRWMTDEEITEMREGKKYKKKRKIYPESARKLIYLHAGGRCELCGREILFEDMTIDHIKPLSMGGEDNVSNLACTCLACNHLKGNVLPESFWNKINDIFMYQMQKRYGNRLVWKVAHKLLLCVV